MRRLFTIVAIIAFCSGPAWADDNILRPAEATATVTLDGVHYTLPATRNYEIKPRDPLCYLFEFFHITISKREVYINDYLAYRAKPGDNVDIIWARGVRINGQPPPPLPETRLGKRNRKLCDWPDLVP